jgi:hypothetical protein
MHGLWHSSAILRPRLRAPFFLFDAWGQRQVPGFGSLKWDMGNDYIENDFMSPTTEEIRNARPLVAVLPEDIVSRATLIASAVCAGAKGDPFGS